MRSLKLRLHQANSEKSHDEDNECDNEEDVDEASGNLETKTPNPSNQENDDDDIKNGHKVLLRTEEQPNLIPIEHATQQKSLFDMKQLKKSACSKDEGRVDLM